MRKLTLSLLMFALTSLATKGFTATLSLNSGWNLVGSRTEITQVADTFKAPQVISCWKWDSSANGWQVYLPDKGVDASQAYATSKGFALLTSLLAADGFWLNVSEQATTTFPLSLTVDGNETTAASLTLQPGWNLKAVPWAQPIAVAPTFADKNTFTSIWKWSGKTWAVYLPEKGVDGSQTYAASKGFSVLSTLVPGDGFWVNYGGSSVATATLIAQPPLMGKVSEVVDKADKNTYKPLAGAEVLVNGVKVATTDSQGTFQTTDYGASVTIGLKKAGFIDTSGTFPVPESKQLYLFVQKQDLTTAALEKTDPAEPIVGKAAADKPTPKVITSSDASTSVQVIGMKLTKDITVAVTPYNSYNTAPDPAQLVGAETPSPEVVAGGMVTMRDSLGAPITNEAAGFSAQVSQRSSKLLGKWSLANLEQKLAATDQGGKLFLFTKTAEGWTKVGEATIGSADDKTNTERLQPAKGVNTTALNDFVFAFQATQQTSPDQISGQVLDSVSKKGVPGVFVAMDGVDSAAVTDDQGAFTLAVKMADLKALNLPAIYLYTWTDGYSSAYEQLKTDGVAIAPLTVEIEKFAALVQIGGKVTAADGPAIANAKVTLKTPSVLAEIQIDGPKVTTGKNDAATFKWQILDPTDWSTPLKTIQAKGKNSLTSDDVKPLLKGNTSDTYFPINLEVTHSGPGSATFVEQATGGAYFFTYADGTTTVEEWWFDLSPDYSNFANLDTWTDSEGSYQFYDLEEKLIPFLSAGAVAVGYVPAPFTAVPPAASGTSTLDFVLPTKPVAAALAWDFDSTASATAWTAQLTSQGQAVTSPIGWQAVANPEEIDLSPKLAESVYQADALWKDVVGTISGPITIDQSKSDDYYKTASAQLSFLYNAQEKTIPVLLYDVYDGATDTLPDGWYDWLEVNPNEPAASDFYLWYNADTEPNPNPNGSLDPYSSYHMQAGSTVMVSYLGQPAAPHLLPPASGTTAFWVGNQGPGNDTGTYYDPKLPVSTTNPVTVYEAGLESPTMDLSAFSQATLQFDSWFEVNGEDNTYSSLTVEVAVVDPGLEDGADVTLETAWAQTHVKKGEYQLLVQYNPNSQWYTGITGATPLALGKNAPASVASAAGPGRQARALAQPRLIKQAAPSTALRKSATQAPKPQALLDSIYPYDADGDGMDDGWEAQQGCAIDGHLNPLADADGDDFLNLEEAYDLTDPCDQNSFPLDVYGSFLLDSWEFNQTCTLAVDNSSYKTVDTDGDGFSDFDEFTLYSLQADPCDPNSPGDGDGDWLPDPWEAQWSCAVAGHLDPLVDADGDGSTNYDEYLAMTDPCSGIPVPAPFSGWPLTSSGYYTTPDWMPYELNLSPYAGHQIKLRYTFSFANSPQNLYRGWAIDNVRVLDEASYKDFELLTPDFGYYDSYTYQPVATGNSLVGDYTMAMSGIAEILAGTQSAWTPNPQTITVTQTGLTFTTTISFAEQECLVSGFFTDESYSTLSFYFTDTTTWGSQVSGWGDATQGESGLTGTITGFDWVNGTSYYTGDIKITPSQ